MRQLADHIVTDHHPIEQVDFWPVDLDPNISLGHMVLERDRSSAYGEAFTIANIRFDRRQNRCWSRYICCKELMHVFDDEEERVSTRERFFTLMSQLQAPPRQPDTSPMYASERDAEWMALLVLCPERLRNHWHPRWVAKDVPDYDVALSLRIPEIFIENIMGDYYQVALEALRR